MVKQSINRKVITLLTQLSDNQKLQIKCNKHLKVTGIYGGEKRTFTLANSPSTSNYEKRMRSTVKRFINSLNIHTSISHPFF